MITADLSEYPSLYHSPNKSEPDTESEQNQFINAPLVHTFSLQQPSKIKSSLCKNFSLRGYCSYGSKCQFAHGPQQLRCNETVNTCYKTKPCFSFLKKEYCPYGMRCNFKHKEENTVKNVGIAMFENFPQLVVMVKRDSESKFLKKLAGK